MNRKPTYRELEERVHILETKLADKNRTRAQQVLCLLADEWRRSGPPGIIDARVIARKLALPLDDLRDILAPLYKDGWVDHDQGKIAVYLTPEGYEKALSLNSD